MAVHRMHGACEQIVEMIIMIDTQPPTRRERDTQRGRVYKSDAALRPFARSLPTVADIEKFVAKTFASRRVQAAWPDSTMWLPDVHDGRGRRRAGATSSYITMPRALRDEGIVLHELAHTICRREHGLLVAGHGWQYCAIYLKLALYMLGREAHDALKAAFKVNRVRFSPPRRRKPLTPEQRAMLADRLTAARAAKETRAIEALAA
jgi:putative metallohydrolase (TIGR04338 family)